MTLSDGIGREVAASAEFDMSKLLAGLIRVTKSFTLMPASAQ